jgi:hypothetical protein
VDQLSSSCSSWKNCFFLRCAVVSHYSVFQSRSLFCRSQRFPVVLLRCWPVIFSSCLSSAPIQALMFMHLYLVVIQSPLSCSAGSIFPLHVFLQSLTFLCSVVLRGEGASSPILISLATESFAFPITQLFSPRYVRLSRCRVQPAFLYPSLILACDFCSLLSNLAPAKFCLLVISF